MPAALLSQAQWAEVHTTAVSLQSIKAAAKAHGVSEEAAYKRAQREGWLVGQAATVEANRAERIERAEAAGVVVSKRFQRTGAEVLDSELREMGGQTRHLLARSLVNAAGQARRTKHPLAHARQIRDVAAASQIVHGWEAGAGRSAVVSINLLSVDTSEGHSG